MASLVENLFSLNLNKPMTTKTTNSQPKFTNGKAILKFGGVDMICDIIGQSTIPGFYRITLIHQNKECVNGIHKMEAPALMLKEIV